MAGSKFTRTNWVGFSLDLRALDSGCDACRNAVPVCGDSHHWNGVRTGKGVNLQAGVIKVSCHRGKHAIGKAVCHHPTSAAAHSAAAAAAVTTAGAAADGAAAVAGAAAAVGKIGSLERANREFRSRLVKLQKIRSLGVRHPVEPSNFTATKLKKCKT